MNREFTLPEVCLLTRVRRISSSIPAFRIAPGLLPPRFAPVNVLHSRRKSMHTKAAQSEVNNES